MLYVTVVPGVPSVRAPRPAVLDSVAVHDRAAGTLNMPLVRLREPAQWQLMSEADPRTHASRNFVLAAVTTLQFAPGCVRRAGPAQKGLLTLTMQLFAPLP